jgi:hypothetical protein
MPGLFSSTYRITKCLAVPAWVIQVVLFQIRLAIEMFNPTFRASDFERLATWLHRVKRPVSWASSVQEQIVVATSGLALNSPTAKVNTWSGIHFGFPLNYLGGWFLQCLPVRHLGLAKGGSVRFNQ